MNREDRLIEALEPLASEHGLDLVTVEVAGTRKRPILRVFLDTPAGGITLDELVDAQEWVDATIEEVDPFIESYDLEVSSPGIDRPLRKRTDFDRFAGEMTVIYLKPGAPRSKYTGISHGLDGDLCIPIEVEDALIAAREILLEALENGKLVDAALGGKIGECADEF